MSGSHAPEVAHSRSSTPRGGVGDAAVLLAAASAINGVADPEDALDQILDAALELLEARRAAVMLEADAVPDVPQVLARGSWEDVGGPPDRSTSIVGHARRTRASALGTLQVAEAPIRGTASAGSAMAAPIEHRGELLGAVVVEAERGTHFRDRQRVVLELLAVYASAVLARWRSEVSEHEQVAALLEADRMRREFAVIAGHELRTPVTIMRAAAASARRAELDPSALTELLDTVEQQATRFERMVHDVASEWRRVARIRVALREVELAEAVRTAAIEAVGRGHLVRVADERPCPVWANRAVVRRVLALLLDATSGDQDALPQLSIERDARYAMVLLRPVPGPRAPGPVVQVVDSVRGLVEACRGTLRLDEQERVVRLALPRLRGTTPAPRGPSEREAVLVDAVPAPERATAPPPAPASPRSA